MEEEQLHHHKKTFVEYYRTKRSLEFIDQYDKEQYWRKLNAVLKQKRMVRRLVYTSTVAALFSVVFTCIYLWKQNEEGRQLQLAGQVETSLEERNSQGVILSLADGRRVNLSRGAVMDADENIVNDPENKQLSYSLEQKQEQIGQKNCLEIPQGAEYLLILSDGSKVWLNARSRLTYPVVFGDIREVELEGEAYFEVTHDEKKPFVVRTNKASVKVLGTEFNVNTSKAQKMQTVLVKGKVELEIPGEQKVVLHPGELAETEGSQIQVSSVNVRRYTAWKEGEFYFEEATLEEIMQELSDWYCVQTVFLNQNVRAYKFSGVLERNASIQEVLKKIERTTSVSFVVSGEIVKVE